MAIRGLETESHFAIFKLTHFGKLPNIIFLLEILFLRCLFFLETELTVGPIEQLKAISLLIGQTLF